MANEIIAACHVGFKKKIHRLTGTERINAVKAESSRGEKFFLFSMLSNPKYEVRVTDGTSL